MASKGRIRAAVAAERVRESLWFVPGVMVVAAAALASVLATRRAPAPSLPVIDLLLPTDADGARAVLQVVAASVITVTSVVFSLTVVALQITAGNYSPRVLRTFLRDFGTQIVLGTFLATFAFTYLVLQNVRQLEGGNGARWAPESAFVAIPFFVGGSLVALVFFIHHVTQAIRVDLIVTEVLDDLLTTIEKTHGSPSELVLEGHVRELVPAHAVPVAAGSSGFIQGFGLDRLGEVLCDADAEAAIRPTVGDHVLEGAVLGWVWGRQHEDGVSDPTLDTMRDALQIGRERSLQQDVAFGIRQLVDIAVRALSPGVNDPNTAVTVIEHMAIAYAKLLDCGSGPVCWSDESGVRRVSVPYPTFEEYLHIMTQQIGHYGNADLMVLLRLLRTLGELKELAAPEHHEGIDRQVQWIVSEAETGLEIEAKVDSVRLAARDVLEGTRDFRHYTAAG
ncbi:MAG TPA: DUF2254 domain-containing protein [Actinomycetota bacterium]|nr:DUF2254 domain-containing protein [Actinomycetota bacterium]